MADGLESTSHLVSALYFEGGVMKDETWYLQESLRPKDPPPPRPVKVTVHGDGFKEMVWENGDWRLVYPNQG